jgi:hypothetical protein
LSVRVIRRLVGAAVLLVGTAAPAVVVSQPAHAAACTSGGVTVVVDRGSLGGGIAESCVVSGGGKTASALFGQAGHALTRVQRYPGAVCKVDGAPADAACTAMPPADKYWGLFWSDGKSDSWTFASEGVDSLTIPSGGAVAFAWQSSTSTHKPGVAPPVTKSKPTKKAKAKPTRTPKASPKPSAKASTTAPDATPGASVGADSGSAGASAGPSPSAKPDKRGSHKPRKLHVGGTATPSASDLSLVTTPSPSTTASTNAESEPVSSSQGGGLPGWVAPAVVIVVLGAGGGIAVARRRLRG